MNQLHYATFEKCFMAPPYLLFEEMSGSVPAGFVLSDCNNLP